MTAQVETLVEAYRQLKNTKLVGAMLGVPIATVYWRLRRAGEPVTGDKARYGSDTDKVAARGERWFQRVIPWAEDQNHGEFQSKVDFLVDGLRIDVKTSRPKLTRTGVITWAWSLQKQKDAADFFVCLALSNRSEDPGVHTALLVPGDVARRCGSLRVSHDRIALRGKWARFARSSAELRQFFEEQRA